MKKIITLFIYGALFLMLAFSDEIITTKDGKTVLLKDNYTWEYVKEDLKPKTILYAEDAVTVWDKALLRVDSDYAKRVGLFFHYQNNTDKKVIGIIIKYTITNPFGKIVLQNTIEVEVVLKPNERLKNTRYRYFEDNQFISDEPYDRLWQMADNGTAKIETQMLKVIFEDGTILTSRPQE